jgi:hypothetical protein
MSPDVSVLNLPGAALTLLMGVLLLILPRRFALLPIAFITCYMTFGQELVLAGLHFTMLRVLVLFGCARIILWMEFRSFKWRWIDTLMVLWVISDITVYTLLWQTTGALINRLGFAYNAFGLYFIFRVLIRDIEDIKVTCRLFALLVFPLAICMSFEHITGRNPFYVFGGVPQFTGIRDGALRCQGPFQHPILAGTFGAVWLPLFVGLWLQGKGNRFLALVGILSSTVITFLAASTGPLGTYLAGVAGIGMWRMRNHIRPVLLGIAAFLVALEIIMAGHVWYIFGYLSDINLGFHGSQGWHRSILTFVPVVAAWNHSRGFGSMGRLGGGHYEPVYLRGSDWWSHFPCSFCFRDIHRVFEFRPSHARRACGVPKITLTALGNWLHALCSRNYLPWRELLRSEHCQLVSSAGYGRYSKYTVLSPG